MSAITDIPTTLSDWGAHIYNDHCQPKWLLYLENAALQVTVLLTTHLAMLADVVAALFFQVWAFFSTTESDALSERACRCIEMSLYGGHLVFCLALRRLFCPCETEVTSPP